MSLVNFIEAQFPSLDGWEYTVDPVYEVPIAKYGSREIRALPSNYPRRRITVRIPADKYADIIQVNKWHHAVRGKAVGFRVKDPTDFLSVDIVPYDTLQAQTDALTSPTDQPLTLISGNDYQLYKQYQVDLGGGMYLTQSLPIFKPVDGTIRVANDSATEQAETTHWTLNYETGVLTKGGSFTGTPTTWGGQYDLPMRFDSSLPIEVRDQIIDEVVFELLELPRGEFA